MYLLKFGIAYIISRRPIGIEYVVFVSVLLSSLAPFAHCFECTELPNLNALNIFKYFLSSTLLNCCCRAQCRAVTNLNMADLDEQLQADQLDVEIDDFRVFCVACKLMAPTNIL